MTNVIMVVMDSLAVGTDAVSGSTMTRIRFLPC